MFTLLFYVAVTGYLLYIGVTELNEYALLAGAFLFVAAVADMLGLFKLEES